MFQITNAIALSQLLVNGSNRERGTLYFNVRVETCKSDKRTSVCDDDCVVNNNENH